jgi:sulfide:quinone oxidoreductase
MTFRDADADATFHGIIQDIEQGYTHSLAFIQPVGPVWPLPLYELALMTAERAASMDIRDFSATIVTPERRPLAVFGPAVSDVVSERLQGLAIEVFCDALAKVPAKGRVQVEPQGVTLQPQRIITMPRIAGPAIRGLAGGGASGFIPIDKHCCVPGTGARIFAAGDAVNYPIKHGGLGTQMADVAAGDREAGRRSGLGAGLRPRDSRQAADRLGSDLHDRASGRLGELRFGGLRQSAMVAGR